MCAFPNSLIAAAEGADAVINLVGILFPTGKQSFKSVQDEGARHVAEVAKASGARSLVHVSAIGADANSPSVYGRSKAAGEAAVKAVFPEAVILRPSVVFGPEDDFFNRFAALARLSPVLPLIGGGQTKFQPVFVGDVARSVVAALTGLASARQALRARRARDPHHARRHGARARLLHARAAAGAVALLARQAASRLPAMAAHPAAHGRPGAAAAKATMW